MTRIHILGLGSIGTFAAHCLSQLPNAPARTLLFHRASLLDAYKANKERITLQTTDGERIAYTGYDVEVYKQNKWFHNDNGSETPTTETIKNLIVSVKATQTVSALEPLKHRLTPKSTILFLQNGCGMIDEVNGALFPDPAKRPKYIVGVISHGVTLNRPFDITHTGFAATSLGLVPGVYSSRKDGQEEYMLENLPLSSRLNAKAYAYTEVLQIQLEKLAVNAFCNPVCAIHDAKNGFLFTLPELRRRILSEISAVVLALPELKHDEERVKERFGVDRLEETVNGILRRTAETTCSMVWDLRGKRETEVRFINGYWVKRGRELGMEMQVNRELVEEVERRSVYLL
ncbi:hypothetical protein ASPWEDRAFT_173828 [Aspergillus wentii DTO 134E9]|uniref:2-dehydropantoate 2-reductase n=1 Tax=Aspergillus wentii DTO 134E9 TaxID=1073089 RepID=A0A1L9RHU4_ASPWE|nr:uncharacterized protein ASPWEDRAFT_173828 [Aspergillus wentii DTO 134E9]KAI9925746.1 hypothetical protein MW887_005552 [Aspergillus wentii]OJJ34413.1 hypothetical protein ASPWEDRAFT_173828 [Aspergillus wentii DTO 134E9]